MPFANFKVPEGTLTAEQKELIVHSVTDLYVEIYGERAAPIPWSSWRRYPTAAGESATRS